MRAAILHLAFEAGATRPRAERFTRTQRRWHVESLRHSVNGVRLMLRRDKLDRIVDLKLGRVDLGRCGVVTISTSSSRSLPRDLVRVLLPPG